MIERRTGRTGVVRCARRAVAVVLAMAFAVSATAASAAPGAQASRYASIVVDADTGAMRWITRFPAWHAHPDDTGLRFVCDTAFPDVGLHLFPAREPGEARLLCRSDASSVGAHWAQPFPYNDGPKEVYAPQHTHPHPRFSPDGRRVLFTSDATGHAQLYECFVDEEGS